MLLASYVLLLALAIGCVYFGSLASLPHPRNPDGSRSVNDIPDRVTPEDAILFPVLGSIVLFALYLLLRYFGPEWINYLLGFYFAIVGVASVWKVLIAVTRWAHKETVWNSYREFKTPFFSVNSISVALFPLGAAPSLLYLFYARSAVLTDILGISVAIGALSVLKLDSFRTGTILLTGLFIYDIWWVFGTAWVGTESVMVKVATGLDVPIKLVVAKSVTERGYTMLGLGDIVVPGLFCSLALRYDHHSARSPPHTRFAKPYFYTTLAAYLAGLVATVSVMHIMRTGQPALLYLSPSLICSFYMCSVLRKETGAAWGWSDVEEEEESSKRK
ncbi:Sec7-like domain belongs to guanine nucleotide exchange factors [Mycena kentingensis (nom. inval.)]|nr:Sec7-like domain belongs to guanine nucleotide exchange factors [Mycena kentingensis (nom. inval.)]